MTSHDAGRESLGEALIAVGWCQGSVFVAPSVCFAFNDLAESGVPITVKQRKTRSKEKLVLVTQTCDIRASADREPYVEALICSTERNRVFLDHIDRNSARWFVIDPQAGLVANAMYRVQISKGALATLTPQPWPGSLQRLGQFVRWLGRRYDRPALPDQLVDAFQAPVGAMFESLFEANPMVAAAFSRAVQDVRASVPSSPDPPFDIELVLLSRREELSQEEADAIDSVVEAIRTAVDPQMVRLGEDVRVLTDEEISLAEYLATRPLYLEYFTYRGEETQGLEPYPRA